MVRGIQIDSSSITDSVTAWNLLIVLGMNFEVLKAKWKAERERKAFLALADGTVFHGVAFGAPADQVGEVVFNTGMSGYQEILTDPSYAGQIVTLTTAEVGNYGTNPEDVESRGLFLHGFVVNGLNDASNFRSTKSLDQYLKDAGVPGIYGVDTRALTIHLRDHGNQKAYLCVTAAEEMNSEEGRMKKEAWAIEQARAWEGLDGQDYAAKVTCDEPYEFKSDNLPIKQFPPRRLLRLRREDEHPQESGEVRAGDCCAGEDACGRGSEDETRRGVPLERPGRPGRRHVRPGEHQEAPRV